MKGRKYNKRTRILSLVLSLALLIGIMPAKVSAADSLEDLLCLNYNMGDYCELKIAQIPGTSYNVILYSWRMGGGFGGNQLDSSIAQTRVSVPTEVKEDNTWDMDPVIFTDHSTTSANNMIIAWADANKTFGGSETGDEIAGSMRITVDVMDSNGYSLNPNTVAAYTSDNVCTYDPHVAKIGDKILITWVVCHDVKNDAGAYGIEGLYYDPDTYTFSSDDNTTDADGNVLPMVFAKSCNYISDHTAAELNGSAAVLFEEAVNGTRVSDVMYDRVYRKNYCPVYSPDDFKNNNIKLATCNGTVVDTVSLPDTYGGIVETDLPRLLYYCDGKIREVRSSLEAASHWMVGEIADVSGTGDTTYSVISRNGSMRYIVAKEYSPLKTDKTEIELNGIKYTKSADGKWLDEQNAARDIMQEDVRLYYHDSATDKTTLLPQKLRDSDGLNFLTSPAMILNDSDQLVAIWMFADITKDSGYNLYYTIYDQQSVQKADYSAVKEAIDKANALNQEDYIDFSAVTAAIDAVEYDKDYTGQSTVDGYAAAIENAIRALTLHPADYTAVDDAIAKVSAIDGDLYQNFAAVTAAVDAVDRGRSFKEQADVDAMAAAIENAIQALVYKDADYTAVDAAIAKADALDKSLYRDFTAVTSAINAVVRGKNITEQAEADAMAAAIENAIQALVYKDADYTAVDAAIAKADALDKSLYKDFTAVTAAIDAVVRGKDITQQAEVDRMVQAIENAIAALTYRDVDYSRVDAAIAKANALDKSLYRDFTAVTAAVDAVVRGKDITQQAEVDRMAQAIENAIAALEYKSADYSKVDAAIAKAYALNKTVYKDFSGVEAAVHAAARGKNITEQAEVDKMAEAIEAAIATLEYRDADYSKVDAALKKAKALKQNQYKDFSEVKAAVSAVVRGKSIMEQAEVDRMAQAIREAIAELEYKSADYSKVDKAIKKANDLKQSDYKDFSEVKAAVGAVVRGKSITEQKKVDRMAKAIEDAIAALEKKQVNTKPKTDNNTPTNTQTGTGGNTTPGTQTGTSGSTAPITQSGTAHKSPKTGDSSNLELWIALLFVSGGIFTGITVIGKKKKQTVR